MEPITGIIILTAAGPIVYWLWVAHVKGAPYLPTPPRAVEKMLELAEIKPDEKVYDIGCGDGRLVIAAARDYQAKAVGFEISPPVYLTAKLWHKMRKTETNARILFKDSRTVDFSDADVIVNFMTPDSLKETWREKLESELKPSARVLSYAFAIDGWKPSLVTEPEKAYNVGPIYLYKMSDIK